MAIVKMKRLRLAAMQSDREALLQLLQRMGCVEIDEPSVDWTDPVWAGLGRPDGSALTAAREDKNAAQHALDVLKGCAKPKGGLLKGRPVVPEQEFFDGGAYRQAMEAVKSINDGERNIAALRAEQSKRAAQRAALAPWLTLDLPLETGSAREVAVQLGTVSAATPFVEIAGAVQAQSELAQLTLASADRELQYILLVCHAGALEGVLDVLKDYGWSRIAFRDLTGTAQENDNRLAREIEELGGQVTREQAHIVSLADRREDILRAVDRAGIEIDREEGKSRLVDTQTAFFLEGWVPAENWEETRQALAPYACAWETADPSPEEYPQVPVKLKNNWLTRPLNMVTEMYSLPAYGSMDPNPVMAPFFIFFYGFMMADMGYGLLMMLAAAVVMKKTRPKGPTMRYMVPLLGLCGVSTFIMGALTGGFFGDLLPQLAMMLNPETTFTAMPGLFSPLDDALAVLIGSLAIGVAQIFTGMAVSMYRKIKQGRVMEALCAEGAWYLVFILAAVGVVTGFVSQVLIAALAVIVLTQGYGKKGIGGKLMGIGGSLYNNITGYFSDILSYSRLMALMLAGAVIAQVFNTLGGITGNVVTFFIISMVGNALNFALNLLGCYVHDMRLQCLEFFGRFYEDGGKPFRPMSLDTQFVDIAQK